MSLILYEVNKLINIFFQSVFEASGREMQHRHVSSLPRQAVLEQQPSRHIMSDTFLAAP